jgi:hypothetical protein
MVFGGGALPGPGYIRLGDPTRKGQVQSLSGHDGVQVRMLAQRPPVAFAKGGTSLFVAFALARLATTESPALATGVFPGLTRRL